MSNNIMRIPMVLSLMILHLAFAYGQDAKKSQLEQDFEADLKKVVCKNGDRLEAVKQLFLEKGAKNEEIVIEEVDKNKNLVVTVKGAKEGILVIGAHYDKVRDGCGAIDNWSGIVILSRLFAALSEKENTNTIIFVAFGSEEKGLIGSGKMVEGISRDSLKNYCAMINFDSFGLSFPQAMENTSDRELIEVAEKVASEIEMPFSKAEIENASSDSVSFQDAGIPSITLHGLNNQWQKYLHNNNDRLKNVNTKSVIFGYFFGLNFVEKIDSLPCRGYDSKQ